MCGQYIPLDHDEFDKCVRALAKNRTDETVCETHEVKYPSQTADIISKNGAEKGVFGIKLSGGSLVINARIEGLRNSRMFSPLLTNGRCVIPASAYFEWKKNGRQRSKYRFFNDKGKPLFFAGLCSKGRFVIITTEAFPEIHDIHSRMPRCLTLGEAEKWIKGGTSEIIDIGQSVHLAATPVRA